VQVKFFPRNKGIMDRLTKYIFTLEPASPKVEKALETQFNLAYQALLEKQNKTAKEHLDQVADLVKKHNLKTSPLQAGGMKKAIQFVKENGQRVSFRKDSPTPKTSSRSFGPRGVSPATSHRTEIGPERSPTASISGRYSPRSDLSSPDESPRPIYAPGPIGPMPNPDRSSPGSDGPGPTSEYGSLRTSNDFYKTPSADLIVKTDNPIKELGVDRFYLNMDADQAAKYIFDNASIPFLLRPLSAQAKRQTLPNARPFVSITYFDPNTNILNKSLIFETTDGQYTTDNQDVFATLLDLLVFYQIVDRNLFTKSLQVAPAGANQPYGQITTADQYSSIPAKLHKSKDVYDRLSVIPPHTPTALNYDEGPRVSRAPNAIGFISAKR